MTFVKLEDAYKFFDQAKWNDVGNCLDDNVVLYDYDVANGQPGHKIVGKAAVVQALQAIRAQIGPYQLVRADNPPHDPVRLVPGGAAIDEMTLQGPAAPNDPPRRQRRIQKGTHRCTDLFRFNPVNGRIDEIHYCVAEA